MNQFRGKLVGLLVIVLVALIPGNSKAEMAGNEAAFPGPGNALAPFSLPVPDNSAYAAYLGLTEGSRFRPTDLKADLWLFEVFNVYCASCMFVRPHMNELFAKIEADPALKGRVKMVAVGAGNQMWDIKPEEAKYDFPILPDEAYAFHNMVGQPPTPFLIFARPYDQDKLVVMDTHLGRFSESAPMFEKVRNALSADISTMKVTPFKGPSTDTQAQAPPLPLSESEVMQKVRESLTIDGKMADGIEVVPLPGWDGIYTGTLGKRIFARVVARWIPCSDCHNVFYVYSFDSEGRFLKFVPLSIHKYGNEPWNDTDAAKIQTHLHGASLLEAVPYSPRVDAVTSATISTEVIYNSIQDTPRLIDALVRKGYIPKKP